MHEYGTSNREQYIIHSVKKAMHVVRVMVSSPEPLSVAQIAMEAGINKSVCHKILITLCEDGIVGQTKTGSYRPGLGLIQLGQLAMSHLAVFSIARDSLENVTNTTGESTALYVETGGEMVCYVKSDSPLMIRHYVALGRPIPLYAGAAGKIFLAAYTPDQLDEYLRTKQLAPIGSQTITDPARLKAELEAIRINGIAWSTMETTTDAIALAAPIRNKNGSIIATISVAGPIERFSVEKEPVWLDAMNKASSDISSAFGFSGNEKDAKWALERFE